MKNILITGISGYLGTRLTQELKRRNHTGKIVGIDISPPSDDIAENISFYKKDIRDPEIGELFVRYQIDTVLHLAFVVKPIHHLKQMHDIDSNGTLNTLNQSLNAGTCRYCIYYGKKCPIPLEGSCVHKFFEKKKKSFGYMQLVWATVTYGFRVFLPVIFIFRYEMTGWGISYFSLLTVFWIIHLRFTGCPNCINVQCPLNPDYTFNTSTRR